VAPLEFWIVAAGLVGLLVGSYLNVVIHRLPAGVSTVTPPSRCPVCGALVRPRDNVPVVGWLLLRGRCRDCRAPISVRYPLVELATGLAFAGSVARFGLRGEAFAAALLAALLLALAGIDFDHYLLPDRITVPGIVVGLALQLVLATGSFSRGLSGALVGAGILLVLAGAWELVRGVEGMGLGDVKMLAMIGAFLGVQGVLVTLVLGTLAGSLVGVVLAARRGSDFSLRLPFGVFLALGGWISIFAGNALVALYLGRPG